MSQRSCSATPWMSRLRKLNVMALLPPLSRGSYWLRDHVCAASRCSSRGGQQRTPAPALKQIPRSFAQVKEQAKQDEASLAQLTVQRLLARFSCSRYGDGRWQTTRQKGCRDQSRGARALMRHRLLQQKVEASYRESLRSSRVRHSAGPTHARPEALERASTAARQ